MESLRRILSCLFTGTYGAIAGAAVGWVGTFWMWGIGFLFGLPAGFVFGVVCGLKLALRDAAILLGSCLGGLAYVMWLCQASDVRDPLRWLAMLIVIAMSGPLCWLAREYLTLTTRFWLALLLMAGCALNIGLFIWVRT